MSDMPVIMDKTALYIPIDILNTIARADRLFFLQALYSGRQGVSDLTHMFYPDSGRHRSTQTSAAMTPMKRLGLVTSYREGRNVFYELTGLGLKVVRFIHDITNNKHESHEE